VGIKCEKRDETGQEKKRMGAFTHMPWTLELDDLVAILVNENFFLRAVSSVLYKDE
jgi:hypothetical protein